jgi:integrase
MAHQCLDFQAWETMNAGGHFELRIFPNVQSGKVPHSASIFVADYLRPAALAIGVPIPDGARFGFHNLRHSLGNWLVNKRNENPKTVQGLLRHAKIQTTLDRYTESDLNEIQAAQGAYLTEMGMGSEAIQ